MAETEIQQIKKEYISDRIKESIDIFGSQPERFGTNADFKGSAKGKGTVSKTL